MSSYLESLKLIRQQKPLLHCISNIVSANSCANLALAVGARPIMAQAPEETAEIAESAQAVVLNLGTPSAEKYLACARAGQSANRKGIPVVIDPVGVGASKFRREETFKLLQEVEPGILRVNFSEAQILLGMVGKSAGVDADSSAPVDDSRETIAKKLALQYHCTVLLTGESDIVTDGTRLETITGGSERMKLVTGTGCQLSVLCGAFASVEQDSVEAAVAASSFWKTCAETAKPDLGLGSYAVELINQAEKLTSQNDF